ATASNQVRIGNTAVTYAGVQVAWTITSDKRWKTEIQPSGLGLSFIKALRPVSYIRKNDATKKIEYGFIAQEVETLLSASGVANSGLITKDEEGLLSMRYNDLISPMVKAIQEQQDMIEELKLRNKDLEARLKALEKKQ
ncbi:MAG: tail fiber domain-containing protein, partial [Bacteroidia bacterium]|nr:tail fiber domain-containing protein [Bacteroidia bacterium]